MEKEELREIGDEILDKTKRVIITKHPEIEKYKWNQDIDHINRKIKTEIEITELDDQKKLPEMDRIEHFFGISRAEYLTIPRSIIQLMPKEWQDELASFLEELNEAVDWHPKGEYSYWVTLGVVDPETEEIIDVPDPLKEYRHGNKFAEELFRRKVRG